MNEFRVMAWALSSLAVVAWLEFLWLRAPIRDGLTKLLVRAKAGRRVWQVYFRLPENPCEPTWRDLYVIEQDESVPAGTWTGHHHGERVALAPESKNIAGRGCDCPSVAGFAVACEMLGGEVTDLCPRFAAVAPEPTPRRKRKHKKG